MNNMKMGLFISELRKSQQMTQKEFGQRLNVTDKAVSKWERGLSYPDISLLMPISDILGVAVSELLNGEKNVDTESKTEADIAIDNVLKYADTAVKSKTKSTRKRTILVAAGIVLLFMGFTLLISPVVSQRRSAAARQRIIQTHLAEVELMSQDAINEHFSRAQEHNTVLSLLPVSAPLRVAHVAAIPDDYDQILYVGGIMGRIEIPIINVDLPIFHGSTESSLEMGAGHIEGTAFPTGGYDNHSVIVAHGVNPGGFAGLEHNVSIGDYFFISVLDRRLVYRVDSINIVLPHEVESLRVIPGADVVTLITCVPYRINTHRLLVRGTRVLYGYTDS
ncbi:MAG: class C sortase [Defluviitaleaceae bacterium]|nr:class C sortase [Defluviitaleaceae bacterium]